MPVTPFKIVLEDGSIDQSEYTRCIEFLNSYIAGEIKVYPETVWANPYEVDLSQNKSAYELISDILQLKNNKLLTKTAFKQIQSLIKGMLEYYGATIHTAGAYLDVSGSFIDGPGYRYDVLRDEQDIEIVKSDVDPALTVYYKKDEGHTVVEYGDNYYRNDLDYTIISNLNHPIDTTQAQRLVSNVDTYPNVYKGYPSGVYTYFYPMSGYYIGSSTLFYYSECKDQLYTSNLSSYYDDRVNDTIIPRRFIEEKQSAIPTKGFDFSSIASVRSSIMNADKANASINYATANPNITFLTPTDLTAAEPSEWII